MLMSCISQFIADAAASVHTVPDYIHVYVCVYIYIHIHVYSAYTVPDYTPKYTHTYIYIHADIVCLTVHSGCCCFSAYSA